MTVACCPRCHDEITLPNRARPESRVQCPLCLEEMLYEEVLARVPPMLILLDAEEEEPAYAKAGLAAVGAHAGVGAETSDWGSDVDSGDYAVSGEEEETHDFLGNQVGAATATIGSPAASIAASPPRAKKQPNLVLEMAKMVFGGVGGLALGVLVLWYLPGDYATDIANVGPIVAKVLPQIVPEKFQGKKSSVPAQPKNTSIGGNNGPMTPPKNNAQPGNGNKPNGNKPKGNGNTTSITDNNTEGTTPNELPAAPAADPNDPLAVVDPLAMPATENDPLAVTDPLAPAESTDDPLAVPDPLAMPEKDPLATPDPLAATDPLASNDPLTTPKPETEPTETPDPMPQPDDNAAAAATQLSESIMAAKDAVAAFENADPKDVPQRRELGTKLFEAAGRVGAAVAMVDPRDSTAAPIVELMPAYLKSISDSAGKVSMLGFLASQSLDTAKGGDGIVCAGTIKSVRAAGKVFEVNMVLASRDSRPVVIITRENPQDVVGIDQKALVTGVIVDDPDKSIKGYEGSPGTVVLSGYMMPIE